MKDIYPKQFHDCSKGMLFSEWQIKKWLEEIRVELMDANVGEFKYVSAGSNLVIGLREPDGYKLIVVDGYKSFDIAAEELHKINFI